MDKGGGDSYGYTELLGSVNQIVGYLFYFCTVCAYPGLIVFPAGCCERKVFFIARGTDVQYDAHAYIVADCLVLSRKSVIPARIAAPPQNAISDDPFGEKVSVLVVLP